MLTNRKNMLLSQDVPESLVDFLASMRDGIADSSLIRFIIVLQVPNKSTTYDEGYFVYNSAGDIDLRVNTYAHSHQIYMYAWQNTVAIIPSNKQNKACWFCEDIEKRLGGLSEDSYYSYYKKRIQSCLENSLLT